MTGGGGGAAEKGLGSTAPLVFASGGLAPANTVRRCGQGAAAQLTRIPRPAAIALDLFMPEMNGWRFVEYRRRHQELADIPVIVVTAAAPCWGIPVSSDRVLRKPIETGPLLELLDQAIRS